MTISEHCQAIQVEHKRMKETIRCLQEENRKLKDEHYKDEELATMSQKLKRAEEDCYRGFPITKDQQTAIEVWKERHEKEAHGLITYERKLRAQGCCGGVYSYTFVPTSIGTFGSIRCQCGAEFEFMTAE